MSCYFQGCSKVTQLYILYIEIKYTFFCRFFSLIGYYDMSVVPCALQWVLIVICFMYRSVYMLTPNADLSLPRLLPA